MQNVSDTETMLLQDVAVVAPAMNTKFNRPLPILLTDCSAYTNGTVQSDSHHRVSDMSDKNSPRVFNTNFLTSKFRGKTP